MKNKKAILLISFAVLFVVFSALYLCMRGQIYVLQVENMGNKAEVSFSNDGVIECVDIDKEAGLITLRSVSKGETNVIIKYEQGRQEISFNVNSLGMIRSPKGYQGFFVVFIAMIILFSVFSVTGFLSYKKQNKISIYSYKNITYLGTSIFSTIIAVSIMIIVGSAVLMPVSISFGDIDTASDILSSILIVILIFTILSIPIIIVFDLLISISNIVLIRHEGFRLVNMLGIALSVCTLIGFMLTVISASSSFGDFINEIFFKEQGMMDLRSLQLCITLFCSSLIFYFECLLSSSIICALKAALHEPKYDKDYIIILGCGIAKDGSLLPLLKGRVDRAIKFYRKQKETAGKAAKFIPSGGQGSDEVISESEAMKRYLISKGIGENEIIMENKSTTTYENMLFSKKIIDAADPDSNVAFSTTNYHVFRSGIFAENIGLRTEGMGSRTKWYFWPNAFLREFVGVVVSNLKTHLFIILLMLALVILSSIMAYSF